MKIHVAIPCKNNFCLTREIVTALRAQGGYDSLTVYDNGSRDGTIEWLVRLNQPWVDARAWGFHRMWNRAIETALEDGEDVAIVILNNDIELDGKPDWLKRLCDPLTRTFKAVSPIPGDPTAIQGVEPSVNGVLGWAFALHGSFAKDYRFPEELKFWYGDTDLNRTIRRDAIPCGRVLSVGVRHIGGGSQSWNRKEMDSIIRKDKEWFDRKWNR